MPGSRPGMTTWNSLRRLLGGQFEEQVLEVGVLGRKIGDLEPRALDTGEHGGERDLARSEEHTSELQSLMRISYAVFCLKKKRIIRKSQKTTNDKLNHPRTHNTNRIKQP